MNIPNELKYTKDHEWVRLEGNVATVGITEYAQDQLGDIVYVDIESIDDSVEAGETFGSVEAVKTVADLYMPVAGTVIEANEALEDQPELVNQDPYGEGWMVKVEVEDVAAVADLLSAEAYQALISAEA